MNSPEHNPEYNEGNLLGQFGFFVRELAAKRDAKIETGHTGFRISVIDGLSMYVHTGNDDLSAVQKLDLLSSDAYIDISISAHNTSGEIPDGIKGRIYRIGGFGVRVAKKAGAHIERPAEEDLSEEVSDAETLSLATAVSRTIFRKK
jgi:hypothetical protein